jgi:hypothetical protein
LNEYYRRADFDHRGRAVVRGLEINLYQKRVGVSGAGLRDPCCYTPV